MNAEWERWSGERGRTACLQLFFNVRWDKEIKKGRESLLSAIEDGIEAAPMMSAIDSFRLLTITQSQASRRGCCHFPRVKSGNFMGALPCATESSLNGAGTVQDAASYTSMSGVNPSRIHWISRKFMM